MTDRPSNLEVHIDTDACAGTGMCMRVLPSVFGRGEDGVPVIQGPVVTDDVDLYEEAAAICPTAAISAVEIS